MGQPKPETQPKYPAPPSKDQVKTAAQALLYGVSSPKRSMALRNVLSWFLLPMLPEGASISVESVSEIIQAAIDTRMNLEDMVMELEDGEDQTPAEQTVDS